VEAVTARVEVVVSVSVKAPPSDDTCHCYAGRGEPVAFTVKRASLPSMTVAGWGCWVMTGALAGVAADATTPVVTAAAATKQAVMAMATRRRRAVRPSVLPGSVRDPMGSF